MKKNYPETCKAKALKLKEILGGISEDYYGICDAFCFNTVNDLIDMIINDSKLLEKHSSYQNWFIKSHILILKISIVLLFQILSIMSQYSIFYIYNINVK